MHIDRNFRQYDIMSMRMDNAIDGSFLDWERV